MINDENEEIIYTNEFKLQNEKPVRSYKKLIIALIIILIVATITFSVIYVISQAKISLVS